MSDPSANDVLNERRQDHLAMMNVNKIKNETPDDEQAIAQAEAVFAYEEAQTQAALDAVVEVQPVDDE
jgi:hypothetical protein